MKKALLVVGGILALALLAVLLIPPFIDLGAYKSRYLPLVEGALGRRVDVGEVRLSIVPTPSIRLSSLQVSDNPAFSKEPFFTAEQVKLRLKFWPLLKGQFQVIEFVLEKPSVNLLKRKDGVFNFADLGKKKDGAETKETRKKKSPKESRRPVRLAELIPARLGVEQGIVNLQTIGQKPLKVQGIDVSLKDFSVERPFPYRVAFKLADLKPISLEGNLRYDEARATLNLRENRLRAQDIDFAVRGAVADLAGVPRLDLSLANNRFETKPIFNLLSAAGATPKGMEITGPMGLKVTLAGPSNQLSSQINADIQGLKVDDPNALRGTVVGQVLLSLTLGGEAPLTKTLRGNGKMNVKDGELTKVDLASKIQQLTGMVGLPQDQARGATTFKTLETDFTLGGGIADLTRIYLSSPLMEAQGNGKITLASPSLDLRIEAALAPQVSARAGSGDAATFFKDSQGRIVVPLRITGPAKGPTVTLDAEKLAKKGAGQLLEKGKEKLFERLFRRR